jgi:hypothetical protein
MRNSLRSARVPEAECGSDRDERESASAGASACGRGRGERVELDGADIDTNRRRGDLNEVHSDDPHEQ